MRRRLKTKNKKRKTAKSAQAAPDSSLGMAAAIQKGIKKMQAVRVWTPEKDEQQLSPTRAYLRNKNQTPEVRLPSKVSAEQPRRGKVCVSYSMPERKSENSSRMMSFGNIFAERSFTT